MGTSGSQAKVVRLRVAERGAGLRAGSEAAPTAPRVGWLLLLGCLLLTGGALARWGGLAGEPGPGASPRARDAEAPAIVVVQRGDTVWSLARTYGPAGADPRRLVEWIRHYNGLESDEVVSLQPGQVIRLPWAEGPDVARAVSSGSGAERGAKGAAQ